MVSATGWAVPEKTGKTKGPDLGEIAADPRGSWMKQIPIKL